MTLPRFLQIHTLHNYSATLLNRDDAGFGICQHSCPLFQAAFGIFSVVGFSRSRSGLSHT